MSWRAILFEGQRITKGIETVIWHAPMKLWKKNINETLWNKSHGPWSILLSPKDFHIHLSFLVTHRSMSLWIPFFWHFHRTLLGSSMAHKHKEPANGTCFTHRVVNQPVSAEKPTYVTGNASICVNFHLCWISCPDVDPRHSKAVVTAGLYYSSLIEREEENDLLKPRDASTTRLRKGES